jgi:hypothetical protein
MNIPMWITDILNAPALREENTHLKGEIFKELAFSSSQVEEKNSALYKLMTLQTQYLTLTTQASQAISALDTCKALTKADKGTISELSVTIAALTKELTRSPVSLYMKPMPALLMEVPKTHVMLDGFMVKTASKEVYCDYPDHPSIFQPSPIFESILTAADCNRARDELTPIQISKKIANVLQLRMDYVTDQTQWGRIDNWTPATVTVLLGRDDCESLSAVILSALFYYQLKFGAFKDYSCFCGLGLLKYGGGRYGHAFVVLLHDTSTNLKDSFIIEATDAWASDPMPISEVKDKYDCSWGIIGYVRNGYPQGTYEVKNDWWSK